MTLILPVLDETNRPFWDGCREAVLRLQRCAGCGTLRYPVSVLCPHCLSNDARWEELSGRGEVYALAGFGRAYDDGWSGRVPYAVALVRLEEGPTMIGNLVGIDPAEARVGMAVEVAFEDAGEVAIPVWRPA